MSSPLSHRVHLPALNECERPATAGTSPRQISFQIHDDVVDTQGQGVRSSSTARPGPKKPAAAADALNWLERSGNHGDPSEPALVYHLVGLSTPAYATDPAFGRSGVTVDCVTRCRARASPMDSAMSAPSERTKAVLLVLLEIE